VTQANDQPLILKAPRTAALAAMAALAVAATAGCFAASYLGNYEWAAGHGLAGWRAFDFPVALDVIMAMGELLLFVAILDDFADAWLTALGAGLTLAGLAASMAGNAWHAAGAGPLSRATWAVFPLSAAVALAVGLLVLKRVIAGHPQAAAQSPPSAGVPTSSAGRDTAPAGRRAAQPRSRRPAPKTATEQAARRALAQLPADQLPTSERAFALADCGGDRRMARRLLTERRRTA
jgi:hypothetical protein